MTSAGSNPVNAPLLSHTGAAIHVLAARRRIDPAAPPPPLAPLFRPAVQGFLLGAFALDPAKIGAKLRRPVLIVQNGRDIQLGVADAQALKAAAPSETRVLLPDVNDVLKRATRDDPAAGIATYADASYSLAPAVSDQIAPFVREMGRRRVTAWPKTDRGFVHLTKHRVIAERAAASGERSC